MFTVDCVETAVDASTTNFTTKPLTDEEVIKLWDDLTPLLSKDWKGLCACTIAVIQGKRGWDDYQLLHHYDPKEPIDKLLMALEDESFDETCKFLNEPERKDCR
jgi:hypothetical protein